MFVLKSVGSNLVIAIILFLVDRESSKHRLVSKATASAPFAGVAAAVSARQQMHKFIGSYWIA